MESALYTIYTLVAFVKEISLVRFLICQQLAHKYHTLALYMKPSLFISLFCALVAIQFKNSKASSSLSYSNPCPTLERGVFLLALAFGVILVLIESVITSASLSSSPSLKAPGPEVMSSGPEKVASSGDSSTVSSVTVSKQDNM